MIKLTQVHGAHAGRVLELDADQITLGRLPDSDIPFDPFADRDASGQHAILRRTATGYRVADRESRNGTWLNGQRISEAELKVGDEVECGYGGPRLRVDYIQRRTPMLDPNEPLVPSRKVPIAPPTGDALPTVEDPKQSPMLFLGIVALLIAVLACAAGLAALYL